MAKKKNKSSILKISLIALLLLSIFVYFKLFSSNTGSFAEGDYLFIKTGSNFEQVLKTLEKEQFVDDINSFKSMATKMNLQNNIRPGKYEIEKGMSNFSIIRMLRSGKQKPVKLVINKLRTKQDIIKKISENLEADSNELKKMFNDNTYLRQFGIDSNQIQAAIIPLTYEFYWNTTAEKAFEKIAEAYKKFWNDERKAKAKKLNLSIPEIVTVASIVQEETNKQDDRGKIASVYLNRIRKGMPLQADPTVKFAVNDFTLKRILNKHLEFPSPYNTYLTNKLPPGPICTPAEKYIDAVLDAPKTDYIFFCAKASLDGYSDFAKTYEEHQVNAKRYQQALNERNIR